MSNRNFSMPLQCTYTGSTNSRDTLNVEHKRADQWQQPDLGITSPGFGIFVCAVFACQRLYFRVNCAERGLLLNAAEGNIHVTTGQDWDMQALQVHFSGQLDSGQASSADIGYLMRACGSARFHASWRRFQLTGRRLSLHERQDSSPVHQDAGWPGLAGSFATGQRLPIEVHYWHGK